MGNVGTERTKRRIDCSAEQRGLEAFGNLHPAQRGEMVADATCVGAFCKAQCFIHTACVAKFACGGAETAGAGAQRLRHCGES